MNDDLKAKLTKQLERDEDRVPYAYEDHLGFLTIGIGRLIDKRKGGGLRDVEIDFLLANDIEDRLSALTKELPWFPQLDDARKGVLLNMSFQMGTDGLLGFKNTLAMVQAGKYEEAAEGMKNSKWYTQTPKRAERLSVQMKTGVWQ